MHAFINSKLQALKSLVSTGLFEAVEVSNKIENYADFELSENRLNAIKGGDDSIIEEDIIGG